MLNRIASLVASPGRRAYQAPKLIKQGSVEQLTLKIGSVSDGLSPHQS